MDSSRPDKSGPQGDDAVATSHTEATSSEEIAGIDSGDPDTEGTMIFTRVRPRLAGVEFPAHRMQSSMVLAREAPEKLIATNFGTAPVEESPFASACDRRAYISVHNQASFASGFALFPSPPMIQGDRPAEKEIRYSVYQASRLIAAETGSFTYTLPCGQPLHWALSRKIQSTSNNFRFPRIIAVTGCTWETASEGTKLFATDYAMLASTDVPSMQRHCVMTMPAASEPHFLSAKMVAEREYFGPDLVDSGVVAIQTDASFQAQHPARPFVGIGAVDPYCHHRVVPVITWEASPNRLYLLKPDMNTWRVARKDGAEAGTIIDPKQLSSWAQVVFDATSMHPPHVFYAEDNTFTLAEMG